MFQEVSSSPFQQLPVVQEKAGRSIEELGDREAVEALKGGNGYVIKMVEMTSTSTSTLFKEYLIVQKGLIRK